MINLRTYFNQMFTLDLRSLAASRIAIGFCVLYDILFRLSDFKGHYTEAGALPLDLASKIVPTNFMALGISDTAGTFSLYFFSTNSYYALFLLILTTVLSILFILGYKFRLVSILTFILVLSIQNRNILQFYPGDYLLRILLFLSMFLPMCHFFSISKDNKTLKNQEKDFLTNPFLGFTVLFFFAAFFIMAGLSKTGGSWTDGTAVHYIMIRRRFSTGLGDWLLEYPLLLEFLTYSSLWFERLGPILLFIPFKTWIFRTIGIVSLMGLLVGFGTFLNIHILPFIGIAGLLALIPSEIWNMLQPGKIRDDFLKQLKSQKALMIKLKLFLNFSQKRESSVLEFKSLWRKRVAYSGISIFLLIFVWTEYNRTTLFYKNDSKIPLITPIKQISELFRISNPWRMFPDTKRLSDGWIIVEGKTNGGRLIDVLTKKEATEKMPDYFTKAYGGFRWRRYLRMVLLTKWGRSQEVLFDNLGQYHCRLWNNYSKDDPISEIKYVVMKLDSYPPGGQLQPAVREEIKTHQCK